MLSHSPLWPDVSARAALLPQEPPPRAYGERVGLARASLAGQFVFEPAATTLYCAALCFAPVDLDHGSGLSKRTATLNSLA
jgi:hypothetical protein